MTPTTMRATARRCSLSLLGATAILALGAPPAAHASPPAGYPTDPLYLEEFKGTTKSWGSVGSPTTKFMDHIWYASPLASCPTGLSGTCYDSGNGPHDFANSALPTNPGGLAHLQTKKVTSCPSGITSPCYGGSTLSLLNASGTGFHPGFGYWEAKVKPSAGDGIMTSFYCIAQPWQASGSGTPFEPDIFEYNPLASQGTTNYITGTVHWYDGPGSSGHHQDGYATNVGGPPSAASHVIGMEYTHDNIIFYYDGTVMKSLATPAQALNADGSAIPLGCMLVQYAASPSGATTATASSDWDYVAFYDFAPQWINQSDSISNSNPLVNSSVTASTQFKDAINSAGKWEIRFISPAGASSKTCSGTVTFLAGVPQTETCTYTPTVTGVWDVETRVYSTTTPADVFMLHPRTAAQFTVH